MFHEHRTEGRQGVMVNTVARPRGGSMGAVQSARTGYSKGSQVKGWAEVLAQEEERVVEAGGPGR